MAKAKTNPQRPKSMDADNASTRIAELLEEGKREWGRAIDRFIDAAIAGGLTLLSPEHREELVRVARSEELAARIEGYCMAFPPREPGPSDDYWLWRDTSTPGIADRRKRYFARVKRAALELREAVDAERQAWDELFGRGQLARGFKVIHPGREELNSLLDHLVQKADAAPKVGKRGKRPVDGPLELYVPTLANWLVEYCGFAQSSASRSRLVRVLEIVVAAHQLEGDPRGILRRRIPRG